MAIYDKNVAIRLYVSYNYIPSNECFNNMLEYLKWTRYSLHAGQAMQACIQLCFRAPYGANERQRVNLSKFLFYFVVKLLKDLIGPLIQF